jgi:hypothetical protein
VKYDDASWHSGGEGLPPSSPREYGAVHIGLFVKWCFLKGWAGTEPLEDFPEEIAKVIAGEMSGTDFIMLCDGKFTSDDLNDEGNAFAEVYYGPEGQYLADLDRKFGQLIYRAPESAYDFEAFSAMLDARHAGRVPDFSQPRKRWFGLF